MAHYSKMFAKPEALTMCEEIACEMGSKGVSFLPNIRLRTLLFRRSGIRSKGKQLNPSH